MRIVDIARMRIADIAPTPRDAARVLFDLGLGPRGPPPSRPARRGPAGQTLPAEGDADGPGGGAPSHAAHTGHEPREHLVRRTFRPRRRPPSPPCYPCPVAVSPVRMSYSPTSSHGPVPVLVSEPRSLRRQGTPSRETRNLREGDRARLGPDHLTHPARDPAPDPHPPRALTLSGGRGGLLFSAHPPLIQTPVVEGRRLLLALLVVGCAGSTAPVVHTAWRPTPFEVAHSCRQVAEACVPLRELPPPRCPAAGMAPGTLRVRDGARDMALDASLAEASALAAEVATDGGVLACHEAARRYGWAATGWVVLEVVEGGNGRAALATLWEPDALAPLAECVAGAVQDMRSPALDAAGGHFVLRASFEAPDGC